MRARLYFVTVILVVTAAMAVSQERQERERIQLQRARLEQTSVALQPGEKVVCVAASAFQPLFGGLNYRCSGWALSMDTYPPNTLYVSFTAPVILPHNARITRLILLCYDNCADENKEVGLSLRYAENTSLGARNVCRVASSGAAERVRLFQTTEITEDLVDNVNAVYWLELDLMGNSEEFKFGHAKVYYREE